MNNPEIRVPLIIKWIKGRYSVIFLVLVISLIVSPTLHLEKSLNISNNPSFLDDEGVGVIELIKITKEGSCLIFYTGPKGHSNETYVRVLQLYLNGSSSYITPRYPAPVIDIGLIQEDSFFYRLIGWANGSLYEILYNKKLRAIEIIERGNFFDFEESCSIFHCGVYSSEKYEWGINDYVTIGYIRNESNKQLDLVKVDAESVNLFRVVDYSDQYRDFRFCQFNSTLGFYYYIRGYSSVELTFQEVSITGEQFEASGSMNITTNNSYHRFTVGNGIPYLLIYDTELMIVNLLNKQAKVIEINSYPDLNPVVSSVLFDSDDIIHLFVFYRKNEALHDFGEITRFEYTQHYPNGSVKLNRELDLALLESGPWNSISYPRTIQAIGSDLIAIMSLNHFALLNRVNGSIASYGETNFYKEIPEDNPIDIILVVLFGVLILGVIYIVSKVAYRRQSI